MKTALTDIACCLCTRNRPNDLRYALASVRNSSMTPSQVIVSDDSDDPLAADTRLVCREFRDIVYLRGPRRGLSANRNHCLDALDAHIQAVAFLDDDAVFAPDFLELAEAQSKATPPKTIITGAECKDGLRITPHNCSFWGHQEVPPRGPEDYRTIVINATLFPRDLFSVARFDERLRYGCDEADICAQARAHGYRILFCPDLMNSHFPSPINRAEYERAAEVSRLYSTFKRHQWLERRRGAAWAFAALAPLHFLGSAIKGRRWRHLPAALPICTEAARLTWDYRRKA